MRQNNLLYICFNRPDLVEVTLADLLDIGWNNVLIVLDGSRGNTEDEIVKMVENQVRNQISGGDFNVEVISREYNYGCRRNIEHALEYFFGKFQYGWVFEDDIQIIDLKKFKDLRDSWDKPGHLSLYNPLTVNSQKVFKTDIAHYFIWGWFLDSDVKLSFRESLSLKTLIAIFKKRGLYKGLRFSYLYVRTLLNQIDTWDSIYTSWAIVNNIDLNIVPSSLIENLGFDERATHTADSPRRHALSSVGVENEIIWKKELRTWL